MMTPRFSLGCQLGCHVGSKLIDPRDERRIDVLLVGIDEGGKEDPGTVRAHLVNVVNDLGMPGVVGSLDR
jgi:hypothetical protein